MKQLEEATGSVIVDRIGRTLILYRPSLSKLKVEEKKKEVRKLFLAKQRKGRLIIDRVGCGFICIFWKLKLFWFLLTFHQCSCETAEYETSTQIIKARFTVESEKQSLRPPMCLAWKRSRLFTLMCQYSRYSKFYWLVRVQRSPFLDQEMLICGCGMWFLARAGEHKVLSCLVLFCRMLNQ